MTDGVTLCYCRLMRKPTGDYEFTIKVPSVTESMSEMFGHLLRIPKDGSRAFLMCSGRLWKYQRILVLRCQQRRAMRINIPYKLHGSIRGEGLVFFWSFDGEKNEDLRKRRVYWDIQEKMGIFPKTQESRAWGIQRTNYDPTKKGRIMV